MIKEICFAWAVLKKDLMINFLYFKGNPIVNKIMDLRIRNTERNVKDLV